MSAARTLPAGIAIHVVINAGSGADDKDSVRPVLERAFAARGNPVRFHLIEDSSGIEETVAAARQACLDAPGVLVAAGGDGTVNAAAAAIADSEIPFAVVPMGTFNYFARDLGMPLDPEAAAAAILDGEISPCHLARVNDRPFLVNASIGLYVKLMEVRERHESQLGRNRVVAVVSGLVTALGGFYGMTLDLAVEGKMQTLRAPLVFLGKNYLQLRNLDFDIAEGVARGQHGVDGASGTAAGCAAAAGVLRRSAGNPHPAQVGRGSGGRRNHAPDLAADGRGQAQRAASGPSAGRFPRRGSEFARRRRR